VKTASLAVILASIGLSACSSPGPHASGIFQTRASEPRLFRAAEDATTEIGYRITSASRADGTIFAEQNNVILGRGAASGMSARITAAPGGTQTLRVTFVAPPGTFALGDYSQNVEEYIGAVRASIPDLRAAR
jgi:hypothetical protein